MLVRTVSLSVPTGPDEGKAAHQDANFHRPPHVASWLMNSSDQMVDPHKNFHLLITFSSDDLQENHVAVCSPQIKGSALFLCVVGGTLGVSVDFTECALCSQIPGAKISLLCGYWGKLCGGRQMTFANNSTFFFAERSKRWRISSFVALEFALWNVWHAQLDLPTRLSRKHFFPIQGWETITRSITFAFEQKPVQNQERNIVFVVINL
jgi:hypothetical protein